MCAVDAGVENGDDDSRSGRGMAPFRAHSYAGAVSSEQWGFNRRAVINKLYYARRARHVTMPISSDEETRNESTGFRESWRGDHRRRDGHRLRRCAATRGERRPGKSLGP